MAGSTPASLTAEPQPGPAGLARGRARFTPGREAWRRFRKHKLAMASSVVLGLIVLAVLFGPLVWRVPINEIDFAAKLQGPSWAHPFGTDDLVELAPLVIVEDGRVAGAIDGEGRSYRAPRVILTTGTFLKGVIHRGEERIPAASSACFRRSAKALVSVA